MKRLLKAAVGLSALFVLLLTIVSAIGRSAPPIAIIDVGGLRQFPACWHDICTGQSLFDSAVPKKASPFLTNLQQDAPDPNGKLTTTHNFCGTVASTAGWQACFYEGYLLNSQDKVVDPILLFSDSSTLSLGDVIAILGQPEGVFACQFHDSTSPYYDWRANLIFNDGILVSASASTTHTDGIPDPNYFSPQMSVDSIVYSAATWTTDPSRQGVARWTGFTLKHQSHTLC